MSNEYGLKCPECGQDTKFAIYARRSININGEDIYGDDDLVWESDDETTCVVCDHTGPQKSFYVGDEG